MTSWIFFTSQGDFEFYAGAAFASVIASTADLNGGVIDSIVPRGFAYDNCERLPCTYEVPGLYGRAGFRLSVSLFLPYFYFRHGQLLVTACFFMLRLRRLFGLNTCCRCVTRGAIPRSTGGASRALECTRRRY